jgi:carboxyl-terminal processing protease
MRQLKNLTLLILIIVGLALAPCDPVLAENTNKPTDYKSPDYKSLKRFHDVLTMVRKNYVKDVSDKELIQGALNGMLQSLDPHSAYMTEDMFKELQEEATAKFGGLGIEITLENGIVTVVSPIEDTPAFKVGLKPGDKIIKIDGESTKNMGLQKAVKLMRGPKGTKVTVTIMRDGFRREKDYTITRDIIHVQTVKKELLEPGYPYIRIVNFSEKADTDLEAAIKELGGDENIKGLALDLRNNPGGLLDQAVKVANLFVDKGLIVYTDGRGKDQRMEFRANSSPGHHKFRMAILVNEGSASASEIVAGALQDHDRAVIFGTKSFGKASVQTILPLENGTGVKLTTAYYYTPKGRHIQKTGIVPDVDMKAEVQKQQEEELEKESKTNKKKELKQKARTKADLENDPVVKKAMEWLKSDVSVKQFKIDNQKPVVPETAWHMK